MGRQNLIRKAYDRGFLLNLKNPMYLNFVKQITICMLNEDLGRGGDITTNSLIEKETAGKSIVIAKESGILAGVEEFSWLHQRFGLKVNKLKKDGEKINKRDVVLEITGNKKRIFCLERTGLNLLQRMSGIATFTGEISDKIRKAGEKTKIAGTRKTHWSYLDNRAIALGSGLTHRLGLYESVLIKDNHLDTLRAEGIKNPIDFALEKTWKTKEANFIEIEVTNKNQAIGAAEKFRELQEKTNRKTPCIIMLDNMKPAEIKKTISDLKKRRLYDHVLLEASGGITEKNILEYAKTGVDVCSLGCLTHSSRALNLSRKVV